MTIQLRSLGGQVAPCRAHDDVTRRNGKISSLNDDSR